MNLTPEEKAYLAGIIDGEGSIMLLTFHHNQLPSPCISISSTTLELLEWIKDRTGIGEIKAKKNYNTEKHKNSFMYVIKYDNALNLLENIEPYLVINSKKARTKLILSQYKQLTPRNGRYTKEQLELKMKFYEEFISIK